MTPDIVEAVASKDFELLITFSDGAKRRFSMLPYLHYSAYQRLRQPGKFEQAHIANGTVAWDDETDMSPDTLYLLGQPIH